jgi:hypothetical protein
MWEAFITPKEVFSLAGGQKLLQNIEDYLQVKAVLTLHWRRILHYRERANIGLGPVCRPDSRLSFACQKTFL